MIRRNRLNPFKVLCHLLYSDLDYLEWNGLSCRLPTGKFARFLRVPNSRLREYLAWLEHWGYLADVDASERGYVSLRVSVPPRLIGYVEDGEEEGSTRDS